MCLITEQLQPEILEEDLTVYKFFRVSTYDNKISPWNYEYNFDYKVGVLHFQPIFFQSYIGIGSPHDSKTHEVYVESNLHLTTPLVIVSEGFHSFLKKDRMDCFSWDTLGRCIIPKGSQIFKDSTGLVVSNQIIIQELLKYRS